MKTLMILVLLMSPGVVWAQIDCVGGHRKFNTYSAIDQCRIANALEQLVAVLSEKAKD